MNNPNAHAQTGCSGAEQDHGADELTIGTVVNSGAVPEKLQEFMRRNSVALDQSPGNYQYSERLMFASMKSNEMLRKKGW
jgi:hypothetical protein